jgi:hypothetical protein
VTISICIDFTYISLYALLKWFTAKKGRMTLPVDLRKLRARQREV